MAHDRVVASGRLPKNNRRQYLGGSALVSELDSRRFFSFFQLTKKNLAVLSRFFIGAYTEYPIGQKRFYAGA